jgi:hypothetical protein
MNDSGGTPTDKFIDNMGTMVERIRRSGARPVILSASPVNDGTTMARLASRNIRLDEYATAIEGFCKKEKIPYADQFHALLDTWGRNKQYSDGLTAIQNLAAADKLEGREHLQEFLKVQALRPVKTVSLQGDPVHPGPPGQLLMAASLLKSLGADPFVSSAAIDAAALTEPSKAVKAKGCEITGLKASDGGIAFDRLDDALPFPVPDNAAAAQILNTDVRDLNDYTLKVSGLPEGSYTVKVNGAAIGTHNPEHLAAGIDLSTAASAAGNAIHDQGQAVLKAVEAKEGLVSQWRALSQRAHAAGAAPELKPQLAEMTKKVEEADAKIREAAKPQKLHFELTREK